MKGIYTEMSLLMIFIDGFGLGAQEENPIYSAHTSYIDRLLGGHLLWGNPQIHTDYLKLTSLAANLGVEGIPQSATGQTTLWTGVNAAKALGYHLNAYPNEKLQEIIREKSIFKQLAQKGKRVMFANAFTPAYEDLVAQGKRRHTASTLSALAGGVTLRRIPDLLKGEAVFQDMTNNILREMGEDIPLITPFEAGQNLGRLALNYDFTLYEYFQTDIRGHKQKWEEALTIIEQIDGLIGGVLSIMEEENSELICLLTSDHGNIEDFRIKGHTLNPVPALSWSNRPVEWPSWRTLEDVVPAIINLSLVEE